MKDEHPETPLKETPLAITPASKAQLPATRDPLQVYLREIRKTPLLTPEQEKDLTARYRKTADPDLAYQLVTANLRLVVKIALEYQRQWTFTLMDLIQEGNLGLMQAVKNYDPLRGVKLSYYASYWIKAYMLKYIMDNWRLVKIGTTQVQRKLFFNLQKEKNRLEKLGFSSGPARLAEAFNTTEKNVIEMEQRMGDWEPSLDQPIGEGWKETRGDLLSADRQLFDTTIADHEMQRIFSKKLYEIKDLLDEKETELLEKRLLSENPLTLQEIGDKYHITKERVRQIESRLKKKIRQYMEETMPDFVQAMLPPESRDDT